MLKNEIKIIQSGVNNFSLILRELYEACIGFGELSQVVILGSFLVGSPSKS